MKVKSIFKISYKITMYNAITFRQETRHFLVVGTCSTWLTTV